MKRKCLAVGIILLFIGTAIVPSSGQKIEKSLLPTSRGHWLYVGGSGPGNYSIIQDAVDNASNGDTVYVYSGVYNRSGNIDYCVYLNKSIYFIGEDKNTTILNGNWKWAVVEVDADNVEVKGFTIQNSGSHEHYSGVGMEISNSSNGERKNVVVHDNIFVNNTLEGLEIFGCFHTTCYDNIFKENAENGCEVRASGSCSITHNLFIKNGRGILLTFYTSKIEVSKNEFKENGIYYCDSYGLRCFSNNFINNTIQANFSKRFYLFEIPSMIIYRAQWRHNYWSDWGQIVPRPIKGDLLKMNILFYYAPLVKIPWFEFDWFPAQKPYDISGMR